MKVAFVPPWYGTNIPGGAESEVRRTAEHLRAAGVSVEVLTTCVRDFHSDWSHNYHRPGTTVENGVPVRRFPVQRRNRAAFDKVNWRLMNGQMVTQAEERTYLEENVRSLALEQYIAGHIDEYIYVFIPYLFGTTYWGLQACHGRALMIPCLHNESYARMGRFKDMFQQVQLLILNAEAERRFARALYGLPFEKMVLMGLGVDTDWTSNAEKFRNDYHRHSPFILYAGRKGKGKNVEALVSNFSRYRRTHNRDLDLVTIGSGTLELAETENSHVYDLGFVSSADKHNAYAAASLLCQPSLHESFSIVIMEAWLAGTPVLVHGKCEVTKEHCIRSNGGLFFTNYDEFEACVDLILDSDKLRTALATNGQRYVMDNYHWDVITARYRRLFEDLGV